MAKAMKDLTLTGRSAGEVSPVLPAQVTRIPHPLLPPLTLTTATNIENPRDTDIVDQAAHDDHLGLQNCLQKTSSATPANTASGSCLAGAFIPLP